MRAAVLLLILAVNGATADTRHFRFARPLAETPQTPTQTCVVLDANIFSHAASGLADVRLFNGSDEIPYAIRTAAPIQSELTRLAPLNLGTRNGQTSFDLGMPPGMYGDLQLSVSAQNFIASVTVSGSQAEDAGGQTKLGTFTIFDLSAQKLGRSTVLHLPASNFRYLHLTIGAPLKPEEIGSASIVRTPLAETLYEEVADTSVIAQRGSTSVIEFSVPANVPVDRVHFIAAAQPPNFTRDVTVTVKPNVLPPRSENEPPEPVSVTGNLLRLHRAEDGRRIDEERMVVDTSWQAFAGPMKWVVTVENGNDVPLALSSVRLEMHQRELCFEAAGAKGQYVLYYGDSALESPRYDYATLFAPEKNAGRASIGAEHPNTVYQPRPDDRPFTEKHPVLLWIALLGTMLALGVVVVRSVLSSTPSN